MHLMPYPGNKESHASTQRNYLPREPFSKSWETNAGTCAFSTNVLVGLGLSEMYATELETGMFSLLACCKEEPLGLIDELLKTTYSKTAYEWAKKQEQANYIGISRIEIAVAKYIMACMSMNGVGNVYRDIDKQKDNKEEQNLTEYIRAKKYQDAYRRKIFQIMGYSQCMQTIKLTHGDMLKQFDAFASDEDMFIYSDIPYTNDLRADGLYVVDTDMKWHVQYANKLAEMSRRGQLKAKVMLCNYVGNDFKQDLYCRALLKEGWTLYLIKEVYRPTIISEKNKSKKKNKATEAIFLNYQPINPIVGRDKIFTYSDVFEKDGV